MNVALVMERIEAWRGGAETSTQQFIQHLLRLDIQLDVFTRSNISSIPGMRVHMVGNQSATRAGKAQAFARAVEREIATINVDIVHAMTPCMCADIYQPRGGTVKETIERNIALRRSTASRSIKRFAARFNVRQRLMLDLERQLLSRRPAPWVIALSDYVVRQLQQHHHMPDDRIRRIFNGVDADHPGEQRRKQDRKEVRELYGFNNDALLVIQVAHNFRLKGVHRWIEAMKRITRTGRVDVHSLVVGRDNPLRWLRMARSAGLENRLQFVGPTRRIDAFYHAADVLVHPTYYDPCSRVVLEGMAAGLPCITTRFDGSGDMIEDGVNGWVLPSPDDVAGLAERIERLTDADLRARIGQAAASRANQFSMQRHAEGVVALYEEVVAKRQRA